MQKEHARSFYASSFQHLSDVQQRQVGAIVGASVADAAVRGYDGAAPEAIAETAQRLAQRMSEFRRVTSAGDGQAGGSVETQDETEIAFVPANLAPTPLPLRAPLEHHSLAHEAMTALLSSLSVNRTRLDAALFAEQLWPITRTLVPRHAASFAMEAGLYETAVCVPLAALYPYAREEQLEPYLWETWKTLHDPAVVPTLDGSQTVCVQASLPAAPFALSQQLSAAFTFTLTRFMMRNPDPIKNASFRCDPAIAGIFKCAPGAFTGVRGSAASSTADAAAQARLLAVPRAAQALDDAEFALSTVRRSRNFAEGVRACVRRGGAVSLTAMTVGACLGARFGVRAIPDEWLRASAGSDVVCRNAIELATWSWNPPPS